MNVQIVETSSIKAYGANPRKNDRAVDVVVNSIKEYGFQQPIVVDKTMTIIVGHTRWKAAKKLKLTQVPIIVADTLTEDQVRAYRLADNKTSEYAKWDDALLTGELRDLMENLNNDLALTSMMSAFSELEIDRLLNGKNYNTNDLETEKQRGDTAITRRVGLLVLKNSYVNRGVTTYANGWLEWGLRNNVQVDIISNDRDISNEQFDRYAHVSGWISPSESSNNKLDDNSVTMRSPIIRLQDGVDMRSGLIEAMSKYSYDAFIVNTLDTLMPVLSLGLDHVHDNIYYVSHSPSDVGRGTHTFITDLTKCLVETSRVKILCQSEYIAGEFLKHARVDPSRVVSMIPMLGQPELLDCVEESAQLEQTRKGILFIGPYEANKNSELYIMACKKSNKPALLITPSQKSADKFKRRFLEEGIEHEIHIALTGRSKVDAMRSAALAIIPSIEETFCFTAFESAHVCRTIVPKNRSWTQAHAGWCILEDEASIADIVDQHYGQPITEQARSALKQAQIQTDALALMLLDQEKTDEDVNNALTKYIDRTGSANVSSFFNSRPTKVIDEIFYVVKLRNNSRYTVTHTLNETVISRIGYEVPQFDQKAIDQNLSQVFDMEKVIE